jgi:site-specific DNA-methyltransferase (adenine-specific)
MNYLYLGDCLNVLRDYVKDESVDLIYIDPPFNSKRNYNIFFDDKEIHTQRIAFEDTWSYKNVSESLLELQTVKNEKLHLLLKAYQEVAPQVFPYLVMMTLRILELHRVLKSTGSFYLHCDPTASHYLKTICDAIFGNRQFKNEIIWIRSTDTGSSKAISKKFPANTDTLLFYTKSELFKFNPVYLDYSEDYLSRFKYEDENGKYRWQCLKTYSQEKYAQLNAEGKIRLGQKAKNPEYKQYIWELKGVLLSNAWTDIYQINPAAKERLGYPTQKPRALLERIIQASSNEGDLILDGFCGCGTTVDAAESLKRQWVGMDISPIAIALMKRRLQDSYKTELSKFTVRGIPEDKISAEKLWEQNPFAFQDWWITEFDVFSTTFGTKGADKGIDGLGMYLVPGVEQPIKAAFQVKGGKVQSKDIDALWGSMNKHKCELGVFLSLHSPTKPMLETVANSGYYSAAGFNYPRLQILTLDEFFSGKSLNLPKTNITFKSAQTTGKAIDQQGLF